MANHLQQLREHSAGLLAAIGIAALVTAPVFLFPQYADERYRGINIAHFGTDEHLYLTRAKEILDGHSTGQPILAMQKGEQDPTFSNIERFIMAPFTIASLKVNVVTIYNVYDFLAVILIVLVMYAIAFTLSRDTWISVAAAMFAVGGYSLIYNKSLFYDDFNIYLRSIYPWAALLPFLVCAFFLQQCRDSAKWKWYIVLAGVLYGALFYDYFFAWTFASAFGASFFSILIVMKRFQYALRVLYAGLIGVALGIPALLGYLRLYGSEIGTQLSYFQYATYGHAPVFSLIGTGALTTFALFWYFRRSDTNLPFIAALILAGWIALNQQIVTGRFIQFGHYYWYFIVPLCILLCISMAGMLIPKHWRFPASLVLIFIVLLNTSIGQYRSFFTTANEKMRDQNFAPFLNDLKGLPAGSVIADVSGSPNPLLVTIFTDKDLYYNESAQIYNVPMSYMKDALLLHLYLNKGSRNAPISSLEKMFESRTSNEYTIMYQDIEGYYSGTDYHSYRRELENGTSTIASVRSQLFAELDKRYRELFPNPSAVKAYLLSNNVRYVLWDKRITPEWDLSFLNATKIRDVDDIALYSL